MISAEYYTLIYLLFVTLLTIRVCSTYRATTEELYDERPSNTWLVIPILMALFIGLRPISGLFVDMINYASFWEHSASSTFDWSAENFIFDNIFALMSGYGYTRTMFFLLIATIYFVCTAIACQKMFGKNALFAFVVFLGAFSTFSYATNGIKAGAAGAIFLLALAYKENKLLSLLFLWVSLGFHHSMILPIGAFILCYFVKRPKWFFYFWLSCSIISFLHITSFMDWLADFIAGTDERGAGYLKEVDNWGGKSGFRLDFLIYSAMPVLAGYYAIFKRYINDQKYEFIWSIYLVTNAFWLLCMYGSFTNRIAYLSWFMYPIVLVYPFLRKEIMDGQHIMLKRITYLHLLFTLFMTFLYKYL